MFTGYSHFSLYAHIYGNKSYTDISKQKQYNIRDRRCKWTVFRMQRCLWFRRQEGVDPCYQPHFWTLVLSRLWFQTPQKLSLVRVKWLLTTHLYSTMLVVINATAHILARYWQLTATMSSLLIITVSPSRLLEVFYNLIIYRSISSCGYIDFSLLMWYVSYTTTSTVACRVQTWTVTMI